MKMCGVTSIDQLHLGYLNTLQLETAIPSIEGTALKSKL